jgi:hypothetical protein
VRHSLLYVSAPGFESSIPICHVPTPTMLNLSCARTENMLADELGLLNLISYLYHSQQSNHLVLSAKIFKSTFPQSDSLQSGPRWRILFKSQFLGQKQVEQVHLLLRHLQRHRLEFDDIRMTIAFISLLSDSQFPRHRRGVTQCPAICTTSNQKKTKGFLLMASENSTHLGRGRTRDAEGVR